MFDGPIFSTGVMTDCNKLIILNPKNLSVPTGHFESAMCWCHPKLMIDPQDGSITRGHRPYKWTLPKAIHMMRSKPEEENDV